ncbi:MAG: inositol monophosphatase family protein [Nanoarchaeota archaeon]
MAKVDLEQALEAAKSAAVVGGREVCRYFPSPPKPKRIRKDRPPQIRPDRKANLRILHTLAEKLDGHKIPHVVSEEGIRGKSRRVLKEGVDEEYCWYIDPMDNSSTESPTGYAISIGLVDPFGIPVIAAIYLPLEEGYELFWAKQDEGAYVQFSQGQPSRIRVSDRSEMKNIRVAKGGRNDPTCVNVYDNVRISRDNEHRLIIPGGVRKGVEIARGGLDGWLACNGYDTHDICAAVCLVREAGGKVTYASGEDVLFPNPYEARHEGVFWSNGQLRDLEEEITDNTLVKKLRGRFHDSEG